MHRADKLVGEGAPWKVRRGKTEARAFAVVSDGCTADLVVWPGNTIMVIDQSGRSHSKVAGEYFLRWQKGTVVHISVCAASCMSLSLYKPGDAHLGTPIVVSCGHISVCIGRNASLHCVGCKKKFEMPQEILKHLDLPLDLVPLVKIGNSWKRWIPREKNAMFETYLQLASNGVWDQKYLPSVDPEDLARKLNDVVEATAYSLSV